MGLKSLIARLLTKKTIVSACEWGLSNRIKCLVTSMRWAKRLNAEVVLHWPKNEHCACDFSDLFTNDFKQLDRARFEEIVSKKNGSARHMIFKMPDLVVFPDELPVPEDCLAKIAFPVAGFDEQSNIFSKSFAEVMLPVPYHGACRTFWSCQWVCHNAFPDKQVCFTEVRLRGSRSGGHSKNIKPQHCEPTEILYLFNRHVKDKTRALKERALIAKNNVKVFDRGINKMQIDFKVSDLKEVYNVHNIDWLIRKPVAGRLYLLRRPWNRFWWKVVRKLTGQYK